MATKDSFIYTQISHIRIHARQVRWIRTGRSNDRYPSRDSRISLHPRHGSLPSNRPASRHTSILPDLYGGLPRRYSLSANPEHACHYKGSFDSFQYVSIGIFCDLEFLWDDMA
jgi:hypothetical protein